MLPSPYESIDSGFWEGAGGLQDLPVSETTSGGWVRERGETRHRCREAHGGIFHLGKHGSDPTRTTLTD